MKTYKQLIGDALIKVGLGFLGGGFITAFVKDGNYIFLVVALIVGVLSVHFGAKLAQVKQKSPKDSADTNECNQ